MRRPDPKQQMEQSGLFKRDSFGWIVDIILSNKEASYGSIDRKIRTAGELLSADEIAELGLGPKTKISKQYYHALSDKGKEDILGSAFLITQRILHTESIAAHHERVETSTPNAAALYEAEFVIPNDGDDEGGHACTAALDLQGKRFPFNEVPDLPLPKCDSPLCRCLFRYQRK